MPFVDLLLEVGGADFEEMPAIWAKTGVLPPSRIAVDRKTLYVVGFKH